MISEGSVHIGNNQYCTSLCQDINSEHAIPMKDSFAKFCSKLDKHVSLGVDKNKNSEVHHWRAYSKEITNYFHEQMGRGSYTKKIPLWIKELDAELLKVLVGALVAGDGR